MYKQQEIRKVQRSTLEIFFKLFLFQPNVALGLSLMFQQMPLFGEEVN